MRGEHPAVAGDNAVLFVDQHRVGEAKFAHRGGDLRDLLVAVRARVSGVGDQRRAPRLHFLASAAPAHARSTIQTWKVADK